MTYRTCTKTNAWHRFAIIQLNYWNFWHYFSLFLQIHCARNQNTPKIISNAVEEVCCSLCFEYKRLNDAENNRIYCIYTNTHLHLSVWARQLVNAKNVVSHVFWVFLPRWVACIRTRPKFTWRHMTMTWWEKRTTVASHTLVMLRLILAFSSCSQDSFLWALIIFDPWNARYVIHTTV